MFKIHKLLYFFVLFGLIACQEQISIKELNIALATGFPPFTYVENDSLIGLESELIYLLSKNLKIPTKITTYSFSQLLSTFQEEDYHLALGGITVTDRRNEIFDFSAPYYDATQTILTRNDVNITIDSLSVISGQRIGVLNNTTSLLFMENLILKEPSFSANNLRRYNSLGNLINALIEKEVNYIFLEGTVASLLEKKHDIKIVYIDKNIEKYAIVLKKDSKLRSRINKTMISFLETEEWEMILSKWLITN